MLHKDQYFQLIILLLEDLFQQPRFSKIHHHQVLTQLVIISLQLLHFKPHNNLSSLQQHQVGQYLPNRFFFVLLFFLQVSK